MDIRAAIGLTQEMARYISTIHMSNDSPTVPHCVACDQAYPCPTVQYSQTIEAITVVAARRPKSGEPLHRSREEWVTVALQNISLCCGAIFDQRGEEYSGIFEQLFVLQGLTGIIQTGYGEEAHTMIKVSLIHPDAAEPVPLWALHADLLRQNLSISLWLSPSDTMFTRSFLVDMMCKIMQPLEVSQMLDWWKEPDISPACKVDYLLPQNGEVVLDVITTLVSATVEATADTKPELVVDWDDWGRDW